jgi:hypothetical protein
MKRLRNFMLRLIGIYTPVFLVLLGIGACSLAYRDTLFSRFFQKTTIEEPAPVIEEAPVTEPEPTVDDVTPPAEEPVYEPEIPGIGECVCPKADGTLS